MQHSSAGRLADIAIAISCFQELGVVFSSLAMMANKKSGMAAIAILVVLLLGTFGIDRIGGDTWVSVAARGDAGWYANTGAYAPPPQPVLRTILVPLLILLSVVALAALGAVLKRYSERQTGNEPQGPG